MYSALLDPFCCLGLFFLFKGDENEVMSRCFLSKCQELKRGINVKWQILLSVSQKWRKIASFQTHHFAPTFTVHTERKEILYRAEKNCFLWRTRDKWWSIRSSRSHSSALHHQTPSGTPVLTDRSPCCHVAWGRISCKSCVLSVGFSKKHLKHYIQKQEDIQLWRHSTQLLSGDFTGFCSRAFPSSSDHLKAPAHYTTFKVVRLLYWSHYMTVCLIMGYLEVVVVCTLHEWSATGGHPLQDISPWGIPDKSVWSPNHVIVNKTHARSDTGKDARPRRDRSSLIQKRMSARN